MKKNNFEVDEIVLAIRNSIKNSAQNMPNEKEGKIIEKKQIF